MRQQCLPSGSSSSNGSTSQSLRRAEFHPALPCGQWWPEDLVHLCYLLGCICYPNKIRGRAAVIATGAYVKCGNADSG